ncbi:hypothetical protein [Vulgatibacter incomptus]|uniref:hypothetical protein n=1 Tax=Vulgatibacter incomptus TaxID=1391653 RepID=UPI001470415D|nr:hypothetical protein [Vulgatibacter incomptus]
MSESFDVVDLGDRIPFSVMGDRVLAQAGEGPNTSIVLVDTRTGESREIVMGANFSSLRPSPDGKRVGVVYGTLDCADWAVAGYCRTSLASFATWDGSEEVRTLVSGTRLYDSQWVGKDRIYFNGIPEGAKETETTGYLVDADSGGLLRLGSIGPVYPAGEALLQVVDLGSQPYNEHHELWVLDPVTGASKRLMEAKSFQVISDDRGEVTAIQENPYSSPTYSPSWVVWAGAVSRP